MGRLLALLSLCLGCAALGTASLLACGGNDKPPLTPDTVEPTLDAPDASAPVAPPPKK